MIQDWVIIMVKRIFIVDDEPGVIYTVKNGLEALDTELEITGFESGVKFFELLQESPNPDLILLDIMMPEMNGWEVHKRLKENLDWKDIPIIFLTATKDNTSKFIGGIYSEDFVEKPFNIPELKQRIDKILKK